MQSWQMLSPNGIIASQKVHAAAATLLLSVLDVNPNNMGYIDRAIKSSQIHR